MSVWLGTLGAEESTCLNLVLPGLQGASIYETQADGILHTALASLPHYLCSEYLDGVAPGTAAPDGIRCEDLERLSFADGSFDVVISQDVLEHVHDPWVAFLEIDRVLRPGGYHFFTVPIHQRHRTSARARWRFDRPEHLLPPVHHGDPLRGDGSLVYTDFGDDLVDLLRARGLEAQMVVCGNEYGVAEIPWIDGTDAHLRYVEATGRGDLLDYFRYNSIVLYTHKIRALSGSGLR